MELYAFGSNDHSLISSCEGQAPSSSNTSVPQRVLQGESLEVVWVSWCQCIIRQNDQLLYFGMGITRGQQKTVTDIYQSGSQRHTLFGDEMQQGLRGALTTWRITFFADEEEIKNGTPVIDTHQQHHLMPIEYVAFTSDGAVNIVTDEIQIPRYGDITRPTSGYVMHFESLAGLKTWMEKTEMPPQDAIRVDMFGWKEVVSNAIATTVRISTGEIWTWAIDRRFPECLGRDTDEEPPEEPSKIVYLSETKIVKIAAGGFMTAAISEEGELFLWGRSCPGASGELRVFKSEDRNGDAGSRGEKSTNDWRSLATLEPKTPQRQRTEEASNPGNVKRKREDVSVLENSTLSHRHKPQDPPNPQEDDSSEKPQPLDSPDVDDTFTDPYIKLAEISLDGHPARVTNVAVGNGHVIVAAEATSDENEVLRGVFAAGQANHGQLGLGNVGSFVEEFTEIKEFRGKMVRQLVAKGWVSWVVVDDR